MKKLMQLFLISLVVLLFTSCATTTKQYPKFEDSNQLFIEKTIHNLELGKQVENVIPKGSRIALVSIENDVTLDDALIAIIEDQLINSLVTSGFKVSERDETALGRLFEETNSDNYSKWLYYNSFPQEATLKFSGDLKDIDFKPYEVFQSNLKAADYLISYRILECGLIYRGWENIAEKQIDREGLIRLHIRVQETKTGDIILADNFDGKNTDKIDRVFANQLARFHYVNYEYRLPLQHHNVVNSSPLVESKVTKKTSYNWWYAILMIPLLFIL